VYVKNGFREAIVGNHITQIQNANPALVGCQDGIAVLIGRSGESAKGSALVLGNLIDDYQKGGVVVDNGGSFAWVGGNTIRAATAVQPDIAPNGVQISRGAGAEVTYNRVSRNKFLGDRNAGNGSGILLYQPGTGKVEVSRNESFDNDDGLPLYEANRELILGNYSHDNVIYDGVFADQNSTKNLFKSNVSLRNAEFDCNDVSHGDGTAGTANYWRGDVGVTQNPRAASGAVRRPASAVARPHLRADPGAAPSAVPGLRPAPPGVPCPTAPPPRCRAPPATSRRTRRRSGKSRRCAPRGRRSRAVGPCM